MSSDVEQFETDIATLRNSVAHIRGKLRQLNGQELDRTLSSVAACVSELLPLRLSLDSLKTARKKSH